jgi:hypothetical protein
MSRVAFVLSLLALRIAAVNATYITVAAAVITAART